MSLRDSLMEAAGDHLRQSGLMSAAQRRILFLEQVVARLATRRPQPIVAPDGLSLSECEALIRLAPGLRLIFGERVISLAAPPGEGQGE